MAKWRFTEPPLLKTIAQQELWNLMDDKQWHDDKDLAADVGRRPDNVTRALKSMGAEEYVPPTIVKPVPDPDDQYNGFMPIPCLELSRRWDWTTPGKRVDLSDLDMDAVEYNLTMGACMATVPVMWEGEDLRDRWERVVVHGITERLCKHYMISYLGYVQLDTLEVYEDPEHMPCKQGK